MDRDIWDADHYYNISRWGEGYFSISDEGHMVVHPRRKADERTIDFVDIIQEMNDLNIEFPAVIRFHDILRSQVKLLNRTFQKAIDDHNYEGTYLGVYPIKVNQMREVVEEIVDAGAKYNYGLEAGSKAELLAVLAYNTNRHSLSMFI